MNSTIVAPAIGPTAYEGVVDGANNCPNETYCPDPSGDSFTEISLTPRYPGGAANTPVRVAVHYRLIGAPGTPVVVVQGGISADRRSCAGAGEAAGWWESFVGPGKALDTSRCRVLSIDWLVPTELGGARAIATQDQAAAIAQLIRELKIGPVRYVGSSYGGMVGLALAAAHPELLERLVVISASHRTHPFATAQWLIQRRIVRLGQSCGMTAEALALSRQLAITTFRTDDEFADRFAGSPHDSGDAFSFPVEAYLNAVGEKFVARFDAERFLALSESIDLHEVDPVEITVPCTLISYRSDRLIRTSEMRQLAAGLAGSVEFHELDSHYGHDAFLKEHDQLRPVLATALLPHR